jgi:ERCC4-related helicase
LKETEDYKDLMTYIEETKTTKNHPKLKKLQEILIKFFKDEKHEKSKVIIFS